MVESQGHLTNSNRRRERMALLAAGCAISLSNAYFKAELKRPRHVSLGTTCINNVDYLASALISCRVNIMSARVTGTSYLFQ